MWLLTSQEGSQMFLLPRVPQRHSKKTREDFYKTNVLSIAIVQTDMYMQVKTFKSRNNLGI